MRVRIDPEGLDVLEVKKAFDKAIEDIEKKFSLEHMGSGVNVQTGTIDYSMK